MRCGAATSKTLVCLLVVVPDCFSIVVVVVANQQFVSSSDSSSFIVLIFLFSFSNGFSLARFNLECLLSSSSVRTRHCVLRSPEFCGWVSWCHFLLFPNFVRGDIVISLCRMHSGSRIRFIAGWGTGECSSLGSFGSDRLLFSHHFLCRSCFWFESCKEEDPVCW